MCEKCCHQKIIRNLYDNFNPIHEFQPCQKLDPVNTSQYLSQKLDMEQAFRLVDLPAADSGIPTEVRHLNFGVYSSHCHMSICKPGLNVRALSIHPPLNSLFGV